MLPNHRQTRLVLLGFFLLLVLPFLVLLSCGNLMLRGLDAQARVGSLTEGLVLYYPFDGTANDAGGNGYDGTFGADAPWDYVGDRFGNASSAVFFLDPDPPDPNPPASDNFGDPSYMDTGWGASLSVDSAYTINLWIRGYSPPEPVPDVEMHLFGVVSAAGFPYLNLSINTPGAGGMRWRIGGGASGFMATHFDTVAFDGPFGFFSDGKWTMITVTHEEGFGASRLHLYIDGVEQIPASTTSDMDPQDNLILGASLYLAASHSFGSAATNEMYDLICDDVRIYDRALTEKEIQALYHEDGWMQ
jgi:hypothetical protein